MAEHKRDPCYFVSVMRETKHADEGHRMWTVNSYVSARLVTLTESVYDLCTDLDGVKKENITEAVIEENYGEYIVITETVTGEEDLQESLVPLTRDGDQLILNGAEFILNRLLAQSRHEQTVVAQKYYQTGLYKSKFTTTHVQPESTPSESPVSGTQPIPLEPIIQIQMHAENEPVNIVPTRRGSMIAVAKPKEEGSSGDAGVGFADADFNALVQSAISKESGGGGVSERLATCDVLSCEILITHSGTCVQVQGDGGYFSRAWYAEKVGGSKKAALELAISEDAMKSSGFADNIELMSEFKQKKVTP
ncbi:hypothetical protein HDU98_007313 [Podochytrium sp. JEL0797]|nr:hypothetical protein HDU98_007313 [Podochytrium sp. JEL0797]